MTLGKANNFDLIRLAAALQVAAVHLVARLGLELRPQWLRELIEMFPGVPVFFFISGFLISKSFERNSRLPEYTLNRVLRIYPAMIVCFALSLLSVWLTGYFDTVEVSAVALLRWIAAQLTFLQFFNPEFMRQYGVGVLNGSMWTISVELQFYVLVPLLYLATRLMSGNARRSNAILIALVILFLVANQVYVYQFAPHPEAMVSKLVQVSFAPWFYMFLLGVLFQRNADLLLPVLAGRFTAWLIGYIALATLAVHVLDWGLGNMIHPVLFLALAAVVCAGAFSAPGLSDRLLRRNDLSYGVYIYHAPVMNLLIALGFAGNAVSFPIALAATAVLAFLSWRLIEKPALDFKKHPLYQHRSAAAAS